MRTCRFPSLRAAAIVAVVIASIYATAARLEAQTTPAGGQISAGLYHTAALKDDGTVWAWGGNQSGELGDGGVTARNYPGIVPALSGVAAISSKGSFTIALKTNGTVWGWGTNVSGQLGDGTTSGRLTPVQATGLSGVCAISAGTSHTVALKTDGSVWAWGDNISGDLGDGSTTRRTTPVRVLNLSNIIAIAAGDGHSLALAGDGTVWAWGNNNTGQLGDGTTTRRTTPVQVNGVSGVTALGAGGRHSMFLKSDGTIWTVGSNSSGQLGDGTTTAKVLPVQVTGITSAVAISGNSESSYAVGSNGEVWAWGRGFVPMSPPGPKLSYTSIATRLAVPGIARSIAAGDQHVVVLMTDGRVFALGSNAFGALGDGFSSWRIVQVGPLTRVVQVSSAWGALAARDANGTMWMWGDGVFGLGGQWEPSPRRSPAPVTGLPSTTSISISDNIAGALTAGGTAWDWGTGGLPQQISGIADVAEMAAGGDKLFLVKTDGTVWQHQLGGTVVQLNALAAVTKIAPGGGHTLALRSDGTVWSWGDNSYGQLGNGTTTSSSAPIQIPGLANIAAIAAGTGYSVALRNDGSVWAWGMGGLVGDGTTIQRNSPVRVSTLSSTIAIAAQGSHTLYLRSDGTVWVCGTNSHGELGVNLASCISPVQLNLPFSAVAITAGSCTSLILSDKGTLFGCGDSTVYQLAYDPATITQAPIRLTASPDDTNGNGISDAWEMQYFHDLTHSGFVDSDGDGLTDVQEFLRGTDPTKADSDGDGHSDFVQPYTFYNGATPTLSLLSGDHQFTYINQFTSIALDAASWNATGTMPFVNAPVSFTVRNGGGLLSTVNTVPPPAFPMLTLPTDLDGSARVFYRQPASPNVVSQILVTAGPAQKTFTTTSVSLSDSDGNGLPDMWEYLNFEHIGIDPNADPDGDGRTNLQESQAATDPNDFYDGQTPVLVSLVPSSGYAGADGLISVKVTNTGGTILANAPLTFQIGSGTPQISGAALGPFGASVSVRTDAMGIGKAYVSFNSATTASVLVAARSAANVTSITIALNAPLPDADGNGLSDAWETRYFGHTGVDPTADEDGDGICNADEYRNGTDPIDYYNGVPPQITSQVGPDAALASDGSIGLLVTDAAGNPLVNAPVTFRVRQGSHQLSATPGGPTGLEINARTDARGVAKAYVLPGGF